jgi:ParB family chromosome partitioning protein
MAEGDYTFKDPHKRQTITLKTVPIDRLEVVEHQRNTRPAHVANLTASIERIGFIVPLVVIEGEGGRHVVIDGQHRLQAARDAGVRKLPVLVVPARIAPRMMNLNIEKDLNIREKAVVALGIYRAFLETQPQLKETDEEVEDSIERAYYVTLGLAYEGPGRLAGSAFEPLLKKCDHFLRRTLENAWTAR